MDPLFSAETGKAQWIRVADVFVIGPLMVAGGFALGRRSPVLGLVLTLFGVGTSFYNAHNWYVVEKLRSTGRLSSSAGQPTQPEVQP